MMKEGKIKDFCKVIAGQSPKGSSYNEIGNGMEFHQGKKAFGESILEHSNVWTTEITKVAESGDILMSVRAPVGPTNLTNRTVCIGRGLAAIRCSESVLPHFILYALKNIENKIVGNDGAVFNSINKMMIEELPVPFADKSKQKEIVEYLDSSFAKIDKLKENAAKNLEEAKALFQSALKDALEPKEGWEEKTLKELSEIQSGYAFKSSDFKSSGKYQVIRMGNVRPGVIRYNESPVFINEELDEKAKEKALLQIGDMIITQTGSRNKRDYGFTVLIEKDNLLLNQRIARIRVKDKLLNKYLLYYSWTDYFRDQYFANEGGTVGQGNVGMDAIKDNIIPLPSLPEQQSIVSFLDSLNEKLNTLQQNYSRICNECDALKQAILRQVFE